jgi:glyoxylase-like metal-dependent hydrolase (beta-lactamase superfamily II)
MELATGVHALTETVERRGREVTVHPAAVETPTGVVLVDVGYAGATDQLADDLADAGLGFEDVRAVLVTHQDGDHVGALREVVDRTGAVVYTHANCTPYVDGRKHPIKAPEGERYEPVDVDVEIVDGVSFRTDAGPMDVMFTPGHTPGHVSLHFPDADLLLAADALTADEDGLAGPSEEFTPEMDRALDSAARLADRGIDRILCYHGGLVRADGERIREVVAEMRA